MLLRLPATFVTRYASGQADPQGPAQSARLLLLQTGSECKEVSRESQPVHDRLRTAPLTSVHSMSASLASTASWTLASWAASPRCRSTPVQVQRGCGCSRPCKRLHGCRDVLHALGRLAGGGKQAAHVVQQGVLSQGLVVEQQHVPACPAAMSTVLSHFPFPSFSLDSAWYSMVCMLT